MSADHPISRASDWASKQTHIAWPTCFNAAARHDVHRRGAALAEPNELAGSGIIDTEERAYLPGVAPSPRPADTSHRAAAPQTVEYFASTAVTR